MIKYTFNIQYKIIFVLLSLLQYVIFVYSNPLNIPTIDLSSLQQMGLAGNYGGISIIKDDKQLTQIPIKTASIIKYGNDNNSNQKNNATTIEDNNIFELLASTSVNGSIYCSCQFNNGDIYIGGKFSSINNIQIYNIAKINLQQQQITGLAQGLDGPVHALYCDQTTSQVYVGGEFIAPKQLSPQYTNAMAYYGGHLALWSTASQSWSAFPFKGVNGPVYSIQKVNQQFYFGGQFETTADGQAYHAPASQPINLQPPTALTATGSDDNYNDPSVVVCSDGDQHPWLLQDNTRGYWQASFLYSVTPTLFRIANTHYNGRGTYEFGIFHVRDQTYFNLTYVDPLSGSLVHCSLNCTLSDDPSIPYQDFMVVGPVNHTSSIHIDIMSWYGLGGGLASVEIFQSEIFVHADKTGAFPDCSASEKNKINGPTADLSGKWTQATAGYLHYMTSTFPASQLKSTKNTITFTPYLPEAGNYTVYMNTPGCKNNDNCNERTKVDIEIYYAPNVSPKLFTIDQASDEDRNDIIYQGFIHATDFKDFKPHVILSVSKQAKAPTKGNIILVANYVQFIKSNSLNGLSSILTYSPPASAINASNIMSIYSNGTNNLPWKALKDRLPYNSIVKTMELVKNNDLYIGGEFLSPGNILNNQSTFQNIVKWDDKLNQLISLPYYGLNGPVSSLTHVDNDLYIGGKFTDFYMPPPSLQKKVYISQNFIKYQMQQRGWVNLAGGVNGPVSSILPTSDTSLLVSGNYTGLFAPNNPQSVSNWTMSGNCWWHINEKNWIPSLEQPFITGIVYDSFSPVTSSSSGKGNDSQQLHNWVYYLGSISSAQRYASNGFVYLNNQTKPLVALDSPTVGSTSRMVVTAGAFWNDPSHNNASSIILGGQFQLANNNNNKLQNIVLYQSGQWNSILPSSNTPQETINDLMVVSNRLFIGGQFYIQQKLNAFAIYDLVNQTFIPVPDLHTSDGSPTLVNAIKYSDADNTVVVGGNFSAGGSLTCYGVCALDTKEYQWNNLGDGVMGNVTDFVFIDNKLMVAGTNLSLANGATGLAVAYDYGSNSWDTIASEDSMENGLPGPCNTVSYDNITKTTFFAGMQTNTSSAYLRMWNGQQFTLPNQELGLGSYIEQLSVIPLISNPSLSKLPLTTSNLAGNNQTVLLATGFIHLPNGNVSAALYNGSHWIPYIVASSMDGSPGFFKNVFFKSYNMSVHNTRYLPFPIVVLISIAAALGIVFVLVLGSLFVLFIKRRQEAKVGDISTMNNNNPATYYGKPPHRPESLLALLNSPNAGTGLYALKREMMEQQQSPILQDRSINGVSSPAYNNNGYSHQHDNELMVAGAGVGAAVAAGTMMEMKNISSSNQSIQKPPEAHVNHPNTAFVGSTTTTTTLNDLNTNANSRNIITPTATAATAKNIRSSSHDSYNPFRQSYSSSLNLGIADQSSSPPTNEWNTNYNNNMNPNGGSGYALGGTTATMGNIGNGTTAATTTGMSGTTAGVVGTGVAAIVAAPFMNQQQQQQQQQQQDNEIMKGGVRWTTAGLNDASFATVVPTTTTTNSIVMNQYDDRNISNSERSVNKTLNIPSMHLDHIEQLTPNTAQWTTTTTPSTYIQGSSTPSSSLQPQTVELKNLNPTSTVAGVTTAAAMVFTLPSENHHQKDNNNNNSSSSRNIQSTTKGQNGEAVKWTQLESPESHALDKAMITKPIVSTILNENNHYDTPSSTINNTDSIVYSSSPKEYNNTQQQGQPIQWTNYSTSDVKDTLQIKNVTNSMYSDYSFANYSGQDMTLPGISSDFASDPDFAKWTTTTVSDNDDKKNNSTSDAKIIQQQYNNSSSNNSKNDISPVPFNVTKSTTTATLSSSPSSSSSTYPSSIQQTSTLPASSSSTSISSKSMKQPTYTSNLRYSSVILPDDLEPIAPSPRSSISSTVSNYQDHSIGDNNKDMQQVKKIKEEEDKGFSFRWSDIVDSENKKDNQLETQHPLTSTQPPTTTTNTATTAATKSNQQDKDSRWATNTTNALLSTGMEQTKSNGNNNNKNALDGRAASKKMVQEYFSSRENSGNTTIQPSMKTMDENKRAKYKSDFKLAMKQALQNNQLLNSNEGCSEDRPYLYVAKFDFSAREHGELGFEKGDPIIVIDAEDDIWWMGFKDSHNGDNQGPQQGVFPSNYVERATTLPYE